MSYGHHNQGPPPPYSTTFDDGEPLFTSPPEERANSMRNPFYQPPTTSTFGAPPMGEPSEPSAHPDNKTAATHAGSSQQPSSSYVNPVSSASTYGAPPTTQHGYPDVATHHTSSATAYPQQTPSYHNSTATAYPQQTASQPGVAGSVPGVQPGSPYVQTQSVPAAGTSPMNSIMENFNKYMGKAEVFAGNIWSHMKTGNSPMDAARGRMSQGIKLVQEGGFEGLYKAQFGMGEGEQLRKTYACYLSTSTGPVAGTLYISNMKFSFCSDRPLSYAPTPGQQAWSYYKMVVPLDKVKEVVPSFNESKPQERYIQIVTQDRHDFWFMGFVNYDKGVTNMQLALRNIGVIDPNGGLKAPWAGLSVPGMKKMASTTSAPGYSTTSTPGHNPAAGVSPNYNPNAPNPYTSSYK